MCKNLAADSAITPFIGADIDDQRARARIAHALECGARELVELRFVAPVELVDRVKINAR